MSDLDWVFEQSLVTVRSTASHEDSWSMTAGRTAIFDAMDAATAVFARDMGMQNVVIAIDPATGEKNRESRGAA